MFSEETSTFHPQVFLEYHDRCILCVQHFQIPNQLSTESICTGASSNLENCVHSFLCSSATDGLVAIWNLSPVITQYLMGTGSLEERTGAVERSMPKSSPVPVAVFKAHQSGINDIAIYCEGIATS